MRNLFLTVAIALFGLSGITPQFANACIQDVKQVSLFEVNNPGTQEIDAKTGDYLKFSIRTPRTFNAGRKTDLSNVGYNNTSGLELVDQIVENHSWSEFPEATNKGRLISQKVYVLYFKVISPGSHEIIIQITDENGSSSAEQQFKATVRPTPRGC